MKLKMIQRVGDRDKTAWSIKDYAFTIPCNPMSDRIQMVIEIYEMEISNDKDMAKIYRIRKLTARECFRLMGVQDNEIDAIQSAGISESQQYKLAGNSIVVDVLLHGIYENLFLKDGIPEGQLF